MNTLETIIHAQRTLDYLTAPYFNLIHYSELLNSKSHTEKQHIFVLIKIT